MSKAGTTLSWLRMLILLGSFISGSLMAGWETQWIERFDGDRLDLNNWTPQIQANYNNEDQCYTDDDSSGNRNYDVSGGILRIIARRQSILCPGQGGRQRDWTSGRINSKDKQEFLYGRIEARIRFLNLEQGTWPAFWMLENRIAEDPFNQADNGTAADDVIRRLGMVFQWPGYVHHQLLQYQCLRPRGSPHLPGRQNRCTAMA